jgi:hypothetical protein
MTGCFVGSLTTGTNLALTKTDFTDINPIAGDTYQKIAYFYTPAQPAKDLTITVSGLRVRLDDNTYRILFSSYLSQTRTITPERGKNHRFMVGIAESALTLGNTKWARSNLLYKTTDALGAKTPYRFYGNNPHNPNTQESFFSFMGHLPGVLASTNPANQKDPCALVYPTGLWRTPTTTEISAISSHSGKVEDLLGAGLDPSGNLPATPGTRSGVTFLEYPVTAGFNPAYGGTESRTNRLRFYYNGLQTNVSLATGPINVSLVAVNSRAAIWSRDQVTNEVRGWGFLTATLPTSDVLVQKGIGSQATALLNPDPSGLGLIGSGFMNVRCVRDASWDAASTLPTYNPYPVL